MNTMNMRVLKEPLGFIRIIEFPMAILAFATTAGYSATTVIDYMCGTSKGNQAIHWGYSFGLDSLVIPANFCTTAGVRSPVAYPFSSGAVSQSQFFVFTGVVSFFYILAILGIYLLMWSKYENDGRVALVDFVATAVLAFFWFVSSCAWASGVNTVKFVTDSDEILKRLSAPQGVYPCNISAVTPAPTPTPAAPYCTVTGHNYASLNVSLIAGFACFGLWLANLWFIYKETPWYKARAAITTPSTGPTVGTSGAPTGGNTYGGNTFR